MTNSDQIMSKKVTSIIISLILVAILPTALAVSSISISTDKSLYDRADAIIISGQINEVIENTYLTIQIFNEGNLIEIAQIVVTQAGNFTHTFLADGTQWSKSGTYTIRASTPEENVTEITFDFITPSIVEQVPKPMPEPEPELELEPLPEPIAEPELELISEPKPIPEWVKDIFAFWVDGQISDQELKNAIKFLVKNGIIVL